MPDRRLCHGAVIGVLVDFLLPFLLFSRSSLSPSSEIVHQASDVGPKRPTYIAVGPKADGGKDNDEEGVEDVAIEPGDVKTDAGDNVRLSETTSNVPLGLRLLLPLVAGFCFVFFWDLTHCWTHVSDGT